MSLSMLGVLVCQRSFSFLQWLKLLALSDRGDISKLQCTMTFIVRIPKNRSLKMNLFLCDHVDLTTRVALIYCKSFCFSSS